MPRKVWLINKTISFLTRLKRCVYGWKRNSGLNFGENLYVRRKVLFVYWEFFSYQVKQYWMHGEWYPTARVSHTVSKIRKKKRKLKKYYAASSHSHLIVKIWNMSTRTVRKFLKAFSISNEPLAWFCSKLSPKST